MARQAGQIDGDALGQKDIQGIAMGIARVGADPLDLLSGLDDTLGEQEASGEFVVVAGSSHGDADGAGFDLDLQGFFGSDGVHGGLELCIGMPANDPAAGEQEVGDGFAVGHGCVVRWNSVLR